jgi:hypothetical protein
MTPIKAIFFLLTISISVIGLSVTYFEDGKIDTKEANEKVGLVYFVDFNLQTITGYHEENMEQYGDKFCVRKSDFLTILLPKKQNTQEIGFSYNKHHVKAKINFRSSENYYIDHAGEVRFDSMFFTVDKAAFNHILTPLKKEKCDL